MYQNERIFLKEKERKFLIVNVSETESVIKDDTI
jgi:hypothetical protein